VDSTIDTSQKIYARIAGLMYLFALVTAVFGNFFVRSKMIDSTSATTTADNIIAHEGLFRVGLATELIGFAAIVLLALSLYVVLKPINRNLSLLALLWWIGEAAILAVILSISFAVLLLLDDSEFVAAFEIEQRNAIVAFILKVFYYAYDIGMVFFGLGSTIFCYLLFKSRYIPRTLATFGIFASLVALIAVFVMLLVPSSIPALGLISVAPIFLYELTTGFWLLIFGIKLP